MQGTSESMMLGSPPGASQTQSPYLPAFLMGDSSSVQSPVATRPWSSPPRSQFNRSLVTGGGFATSSPAFHSGISRTESLHSRDPSRYKERAGAPPVHGLMESVSSPVPSAIPSRLQDESNLGTSLNTSSPSYLQRSTAHQITGQSFSAVASPGQIDPFYTQGESIGVNERLDDTWITIFGFPPAATSFVLQEFSQYGNIVKHVVAADGNWLHVHYQSKLQAKKALSKNGKVFGGSIMVGVAPCIDKNVMNSDKENTNASYIQQQQLSFQSPDVTTDRCSTLNSSRVSTMRPLASSFLATTTDTEVVERSRLPKRSNSVFSKAMEYMFGW